MILMKYLALFYQKFERMLQNVSSAAVVIGALRLNFLISVVGNSKELFH